MKLLAYTPKQQAQEQTHNNLVQRRGENRPWQIGAIVIPGAMCQWNTFPADIVRIGKRKQPVGQTGKGFYCSVLHLAGSGDVLFVNTSILYQIIVDLLWCSKMYMSIKVTDISTINNSPVTVTGYLAAYATPAIGKHQPGCNS